MKAKGTALTPAQDHDDDLRHDDGRAQPTEVSDALKPVMRLLIDAVQALQAAHVRAIEAGAHDVAAAARVAGVAAHDAIFVLSKATAEPLRVVQVGSLITDHEEAALRAATRGTLDDAEQVIDWACDARCEANMLSLVLAGHLDVTVAADGEIGFSLSPSSAPAVEQMLADGAGLQLAVGGRQ